MAIIDDKPEFSWHEHHPRGNLQIAPEKASLTSSRQDPFQFENYLQQRYRLTQHEVSSWRVSHDRYRSYLHQAWCYIRDHADNLSFYAGYKATSIDRLGTMYCVTIMDDKDSAHKLLARRLAIGIGATPNPHEADECLIGNFQLALQKIDGDQVKSIQVRGSGQSAADAVSELLSVTRAQIDWIVAQGIPRTCDANSFVNDCYTYTGALQFYAASAATKTAIMNHLCYTNNGAVNGTTLEHIFANHKGGRVRLLPSPDPSQTYDLKFAATGLQPVEPKLQKLLGLSTSFPLNLTKDFCIAGHNIFIPGGLPHTHGPTAGTICGLGQRAQAIATRLLETNRLG